MSSIYTLPIACLLVAAAGAVTMEGTPASAQTYTPKADYAVPMTEPVSTGARSLGDQLFHVEWSALAARNGQDRISGYVYNDSGELAGNVELRITLLDSAGQAATEVIRPVAGSVAGNSRSYFDVAVPRSPSYRIGVARFDFIEPRGAR